MTGQNEGYKSMQVRFYQANLEVSLTAELTTYGWQFTMFNGVDHVYKGNLQETIQYILLGKLCCQDIDGKVIQTGEKAEVTS